MLCSVGCLYLIPDSPWCVEWTRLYSVHRYLTLFEMPCRALIHRHLFQKLWVTMVLLGICSDYNWSCSAVVGQTAVLSYRSWMLERIKMVTERYLNYTYLCTSIDDKPHCYLWVKGLQFRVTSSISGLLDEGIASPIAPLCSLASPLKLVWAALESILEAMVDVNLLHWLVVVWASWRS